MNPPSEVADEMVRQLAHLERRAAELARLPLSGTHPPTGMSVWLLLAIVIDARERLEMGRVG